MNTLSQAIVAVSLLAAANLLAENAVILEDFETGIDSASLGDWGGNRVADGGVALSQYTATDTSDPKVTHGSKSLKVDLSLHDGWVLDFKITLSDEASQKVHAALTSSEVARYILRYDVIFPGGTTWMNSEVFFGDDNDQLDTPDAANGGKGTMSIALDLVKNISDDGGPIVIRFGDNFGAVESPFVGPLTLYVDNVRLVDTYAPGVTPVATTIQGFESAANPVGGATDFTGWGGTVRTTYQQYTTQGAEDIRVTEGNHALEVDFANAGTWHADFTLPFAATKLAEILKLDRPAEQRPAQADLGRYTLRFDVTFPDQDDSQLPGWEVLSYDTLGGSFPFSQARRDGTLGQTQTYSTTLDQLAWSDTATGAPVIMFVTDADWADTGSKLYYDNFRIIDTGASGTTTELKITSVQYNPKTGNLTLQWNSEAGKTYAVDYTTTLGSWPTVLNPSVQGVAGTTTYTGAVPAGPSGFMRVRPTN